MSDPDSHATRDDLERRFRLYDCIYDRAEDRWRRASEAEAQGLALIALHYERVAGPEDMLAGRLVPHDHPVPMCCAREALRANIANGEGLYAGGYHGTVETALKAAVSLDAAYRRHPDHIHMPDSWGG